jgi:hypothetical protein
MAVYKEFGLIIWADLCHRYKTNSDVLSHIRHVDIDRILPLTNKPLEIGPRLLACVGPKYHSEIELASI